MKSTRSTNIVLNEKCMCWCFIDYTCDISDSHTMTRENGVFWA